MNTTLKVKGYWSRVNRTENCWNWDGAKRGPYGGLHWDNKHLLAHRVSWQLANGEIPEGMCVCHKCDNPLCVNPEHLFLGTKTDNNKDRDSKKRQATGERNAASKLTADDICFIRYFHKVGYSQRTIAKNFNVSQPQIGNIVNRINWGYINP